MPNEGLPDAVAEALPREVERRDEQHLDAGPSLADELFEAIASLAAPAVSGHVVGGVAGDVAGDVAGPSLEAPLPLPFRLSRADHAPVTVRPGQPVSVGRNPPAASGHVVFDVPHPLVSRRHLSVRSNNRRLFADELGSRNGTVVRRGGATLVLVGTFELLVGDQVATANGVVLFDVVAGASP